MSRLRMGLTASAVIALIAAIPKLLIAGDVPVALSTKVEAKLSPASPVSTAISREAPKAAEHKLIAEPVLVAAVTTAPPAQAPQPVETAPVPAATPIQPAAEKAPAVKVAPPKPETTLAIDIDLSRQQMTLTEYGKVVGSWPISSGREGFRSPTGTFHPLWLSKMWYSKKYDNAPMPNSVFFSGGVAMHATQMVGQLGHSASHGCIRQSLANSATTFKLVQKHGNAHTRIVVHGTPHDYEPRVARNDRQYTPRYVQGMTSRPMGGMQVASAPTGMRRVMLVDGSGNRRIAEIPASDPRLVAYQRRSSNPW